MTSLYKYGIIIAVSVGMFLGLAFWHKKQVSQLVTDTQVAMANEYNQRLITLQNKADFATLTLQEQLKEYENAKKIEIGNINERHARLLASVSNRANRPASNSGGPPVPNNPESPTGATGAGLYKDDAGFLIGYSADAERLKVELNACYFQYDTVKKAYDDFVSTNPRFVTTPDN